MEKTAQSKILQLEAVRGLAALMVFAGHLNILLYPIVPTNIILEYTQNIGQPFRYFIRSFLVSFYDGFFAVAVFFVLSGYVLSNSYVKRKDRSLLVSGMVRRYSRLVLPCGISVFICYFILKLSLVFNHQAAAIIESPGIRDWLGSFLNFEPSLGFAIKESLWDILFNYQMNRTHNPVLWTMSIEFFGSIFVYAFLALFGKFNGRKYVYGILALFFIVTDNPFMLCFLIGMVLCELFNGYSLTAPKPYVFMLLLISAMVLGGAHWKNLSILGNEIKTRHFLDTIGASIIVYVSLYWPHLKSALGKPVFVFLGKISFGLYLIHLPLLASLGFGLYVKLNRLGLDHLTVSLISIAVVVPVSLCAAWLMHRFADRPAINLGKVFYLKLFGHDAG